MNAHEREAWELLLVLGAAETDFGGLRGLDLRAARPRRRGPDGMSELLGTALRVAGRSSGANRRHVDRLGNAVFVVTDDREAAERIARRVRSAQARERTG